MKYILIASNNREASNVIRSCFDHNYQVDITVAGRSCLAMFQKRRYEFLFIDIEILRSMTKDNDYKTKLQPFWRIFPETEIIVLSTQTKIRETVNAVKAGASNYLTYPFNPEEVKYIIDSIQEYTRLHSELDYLRDQFWRRDSLSVLQTKCPEMKAVFAKVRAVAQAESTVLLTGETGTGKGMLAKLIHQHSKRSDAQFISVHCGAIPEPLLESELFGHEKGAFTGAVRRKLGKFEIANGGTLFLDEIGAVSSAVQIKLLQILQERIFQRVGGEATIKADVRIISATNTDLKELCEDGIFRYDLFFRLNVFPIELPPLRTRRDDIQLLVELFLKRLNRFYSKNILDIHPDVLEALQNYHWPGNIRELENVIERAYILENSSLLTPQNFPNELFEHKHKIPVELIDTSYTLEEVRQRAIERIERQYLEALLMEHHGRIKSTAEAAGIGVRQLHKLLTRYGIRKENYKSSPISKSKSVS